jgi:hypothetical protein
MDKCKEITYCAKELLKTQKPIQLIISKTSQEINISFDDSYFKIPFTMSLFGTGVIDSNNRLLEGMHAYLILRLLNVNINIFYTHIFRNIN